MTTTFANYDAPTRPQAVTIRWERVIMPDDRDMRPDTHGEGFWPSRDESAPGYVPPDQFDREQAKAEHRMESFDRGEWEYVGVIARAHISVPIGGGSFTTYRIDSPGLWGIESDAGDYLDDVFAEEKAQLLDNLAALGKFAAEQIAA